MAEKDMRGDPLYQACVDALSGRVPADPARRACFEEFRLALEAYLRGVDPPVPTIKRALKAARAREYSRAQYRKIRLDPKRYAARIARMNELKKARRQAGPAS